MNTATTYRFNLDNSPKKFNCPSCGQKKFVRYKDTETGEYLPDDVGRCDRENNCGYWKTPKTFFAEYGDDSLTFSPGNGKTVQPIEQKPVDFVPIEFLDKSLPRSSQNHFMTYLKCLFGEVVAEELRLKYLIGTSRHRFSKVVDYPGYISTPGATVFWQIDEQFRVRYGKVMLYDPNIGKRIKDPFNHVIGAHWLISGLKAMNYEQVFFGQHLLNEHPEKPVAIVESEKTAIIASFFMPQYNWIATGGKNGAKWGEYAVYKVLKGREVIIFPDFGKAGKDGKTPFMKWKEIANHIAERIGCKIHVSAILEKNLQESDRENDLDLADLLVKRDEQTGIALTDHNYPAIWDYIKTSEKGRFKSYPD